jgi:hypothetical protein
VRHVHDPGGYWTGDRVERQLRLRGIATLPWAEADKLAIASQRRRGLEQALPVSEQADVVTTLSRPRGADLRPAAWNRGPNRNALDALSYSTVTAAPDGRAALSAEVMIAMPYTMNFAVVICAGLRITDLTAWAEAWRQPVHHPGRTCGWRWKRWPSSSPSHGRPPSSSCPPPTRTTAGQPGKLAGLQQAVAADDPQGGQRADGDADQEAGEYQHADHDRACHTTALTGTRLTGRPARRSSRPLPASRRSSGG